MFTLLFLLFFPLISYAAEGTYRSVFVDGSGQLHIVLASGKETLPAKIDGQVAFDAARISADSQTAGWLILCPAPVPNQTGDDHPTPIPCGLALYRAGRVFRTFTTQQVFWDWQFQDGSKRVAYSTGPTHGGATECLLREVGSGAIVAKWRVTSEGKAPSWAMPLRR